MKDFDQILDECIEQISDGSATLEQCLANYPEEAARLEPLLRVAVELDCAYEVQPSHAFKTGTRILLLQHMQQHPHGDAPARGLSAPLRIVISLTILIIALLVSGTAYAQGSLPGDFFYSWKITSERAWRAVARDPIGADLALANRRVSEYRSVSADPARRDRALEEYGEILDRLQSESDTSTRSRIEPVLKDHEKSWHDSGVSIPALDQYLGTNGPGNANGGAGQVPPQPAKGQPELPASVPTNVLPTARANNGNNPPGQATAAP